MLQSLPQKHQQIVYLSSLLQESWRRGGGGGCRWCWRWRRWGECWGDEEGEGYPSDAVHRVNGTARRS